MTLRRAALVLAAAALAVCACSDASDGPATSAETAGTQAASPAPSAPLRVDLVREAMAAVDAARGGTQEYFEVNATGQLVNLFVSVDDATAAIAYVYRPGSGLDTPAPQQPASGPTFAADEVRFAETVLHPVLDELPTSLPRLFAVNASADGAGVEYRVYFTSTQGGQVAVLVAPDGAVLSTETG